MKVPVTCEECHTLTTDAAFCDLCFTVLCRDCVANHGIGHDLERAVRLE